MICEIYPLFFVCLFFLFETLFCCPVAQLSPALCDPMVTTYDFGRKDAHGQPRELHIQQARDAIDYRVWPEYRSSYDSTKPISQLVNCPHFVVHRVVVQVASQVDFHCDSFVVVMCLWGEANINGISIRQGETILVPACENVLYIFGNASFLTATIG